MMSKAESTRQLTDFLDDQWPNHKARDALRSMREVIWTPGWGPDTLIKILPDMDEAFVNGLLRYRVQVSWEDEASVQSLDIPDFANMLGFTAFNHKNNITYIRLNSDQIPIYIYIYANPCSYA